MKLSLIHDCHLHGRTVRHREPIEYTEVKLNSGHLRLEGVRCDGSSIEAYANRLPNAIVAYNENADAHDPDRYERTMYEFSTGREWISRNHGPWEPLIEFPEQPEVPAEQDVLFELTTISKEA